jgi:hypothetical protein
VWKRSRNTTSRAKREPIVKVVVRPSNLLTKGWFELYVCVLRSLARVPPCGSTTLYRQPCVLDYDGYLNLVVQHQFCYLSRQQYQHHTFMMKFNSRGGVSIFELIVNFPAIVVAAIVCSRHGFSRSSGWIFTLILCLVRIIGACCQLATYHSETKGLLEAVIILDSIGISPLLLATLGLLSRG